MQHDSAEILQCGCRCHRMGENVRFMHATNPPILCCNCPSCQINPIPIIEMPNSFSDSDNVY
jgi:hypothetical protein